MCSHSNRKVYFGTPFGLKMALREMGLLLISTDQPEHNTTMPLDMPKK